MSDDDNKVGFLFLFKCILLYEICVARSKRLFCLQPAGVRAFLIIGQVEISFGSSRYFSIRLTYSNFQKKNDKKATHSMGVFLCSGAVDCELMYNVGSSTVRSNKSL